MTDTTVSTGNRAPASLTRRLSFAIALILLAGGIAITLAAFAYGRQAAREAYDRLLIGAANQIAASVVLREGSVSVDLPAAAFDLLALAQDDRVFYRISDPDGLTLTGYDELTVPGTELEDPTLFDTTYRDTDLRAVRVRKRFAERSFSGAVDVVVAHTLLARSSLSREIVGSALIVLLVAGVCMAGLAAFAVYSALRPLRQIERELNNRSPQDLTPLDIALPRELQPAATVINRFMQQLAQRIAQMRSLIADSAHQLRTPVAALRVQAQLAADETDPQRQRTIVARIHDRSIGLSRLTDQLLNHAMIIHRSDAVPPEHIDLRTIAMRTVDEYDRLMTDGPSDLRLDLQESPLMVRGDPLSLVEACKNLVNNSFRYGAAPVTLQVAILFEQGARFARLSVQDLGEGIPEAHWSEAGKRFAHPAESRPVSAGLGLSIVQAVARAHGGQMRVGRTKQGVFEVSLLLPLHDASRSNSAVSRESA